jgi:hypothetical protein
MYRGEYQSMSLGGKNMKRRKRKKGKTEGKKAKDKR